jgi:hemolysin D
VPTTPQLRTRLASLDTQAASLRAELSGKPQPRPAASGADARLQAQLLASGRPTSPRRKRKLDENIARLQASMETNRRDQVVLAQRVKPLAQIEAMQEKLMAENFGAKMQLLEARDRRLEVERRPDHGAAAIPSWPGNWRGPGRAPPSTRAGARRRWKPADASRERDSISEQLAKADKRNQLVQLTAPADAVVLDIGKLSEGSMARAAEAAVYPGAAGRPAGGRSRDRFARHRLYQDRRPVHLKVDAFPFQKHGALDGKVRTISSDAFKREQVQPGQGNEAYYSARIAFGKATLRKMAPGARLLPGMTVSAEIVVGQRSVMSYLLWPLTKAMDESIREP